MPAQVSIDADARPIRRRSLATLAAVGVLASVGVAVAQDSTSSGGGLPGDALDPFLAGTSNSEQTNRYVVDLVGVTSSWGSLYAVGPLAKAPRAATNTYFDHLIGAQALSGRFAQGPLDAADYDIWTAAGRGVNGTHNLPPADSIPTGGLVGQRAGFAFMAYDAGPNEIFATPDDSNVVVAGTVRFLLREPNRLLVERVTTLTSKTANTSGSTSTASFGLGGVDSSGAAVILADGFGQFAPGLLTNKTIVRVESALRNPSIVNAIDTLGPDDAAASDVLFTSPSPLLTPTLLDTIATSGPSRLIGSDFASSLLVESAPQTVTTTLTHLPGAMGATRGGVSVSAHTPTAPFGDGVDDAGLAAVLLRTDADTTTRAIRLFGVDNDAAPDAGMTLTLPSVAGSLTDPTDGFDPGAAFAPMTDDEFTHYESQTAFRGGNGPVGVAVVPSSPPVVVAAAAVVPTPKAGATPASEDTYLVAYTVTNTGATTSVVAAHTGGLHDSGIPGKAILDGPGGSPMGRIVRRSIAFPGEPLGPSISAPAVDRAGNLYFLATVEMFGIPTGPSTFTNALLRANRTAVGAYELELLLAEGQTIAGANSATTYKIDFLGLADGDSIDSAAVWSGNITQDLVAGVNETAALSPGYAGSLGMLGVRATIVYDVDEDSSFDDPSGNPFSTEPDEVYNVLLAVMPRFPAGDFDRSGVTDLNDYFAFLGAFFADLNVGSPQPGPGDIDGDGFVTLNDYFTFLGDLFANL